MNPFTQSTVARPLAHGEPDSAGALASPAPLATGVRQTRRRSLVGLTLGAMSLATGLGLRAAGALPAATGVYLARAGLLAGSAAPGLVLAIDVNNATQQQLQDVRGIGPRTAQVIIDERKRGGRYESFDDLSDRVKGIGPKKAASLRAAGLTLGGNAPGGLQSVPQNALQKK